MKEINYYKKIVSINNTLNDYVCYIVIRRIIWRIYLCFNLKKYVN